MSPACVIDYDAFARAKRARFGALTATLGTRRGSRNRLRDEQERQSLMDMDLRRLQRMYASGERRWVGKRRIVVAL